MTPYKATDRNSEQEVRVLVDVSLSLNAKHNAQAVRELVERGMRGLMPRWSKTFNEVKFAEENALYGADSDEIKWTPLIRLSEGAKSQLCPENTAVEIIRNVYALAYANTESFGTEDRIGEDLAYLMGAIALGNKVDWSSEKPALYLLLRDGLPAAHAVWRFIQL